MPEAAGPGSAGPGSIELLSPLRESAFPDEWYALSDTGHFWFRWRLAATLRLVRDLGISLAAPLRCLDIGSGAGILRYAHRTQSSSRTRTWRRWRTA